MKRSVTIFLAALLSYCFCLSYTGYAEEKINRVSLSFQSDGFDEEGIPEIDVSVRGDHYSAAEVMRAYEYDEEEADKGDTQTYVVELYADQGYYFHITKPGNIKVSGAGAQFVKASRKENGSLLVVTVKLTGLDSFLGEIQEARWGTDGRGSWEAAAGAFLYRLQLKTPAGKVIRAETGGLEYDFSPLMQKEGDYHFQVRPVAEGGKTGEWTQGGMISLSKDQAAANAVRYKVDYRLHFTGEEKTPSNCRKEYLNTGWQKENGKVWYRNPDGSYIQNNWLLEGTDWYYFGGDGYRKTDAYVTWGGKEYYVESDGRMLVSGTAPDGRKADGTGKLEEKKP